MNSSVDHTPYEHVLAPGSIGTMQLRNRLLMAPMGDELAAVDGAVSDEQLAYIEARARGGAALVTLGSVAVAWPVGTANARQNGISTDEFIPGFAALADVAHRHGARLGLQLTHMGKVARNDIAAGRAMWVPSVPAREQFDPLLAMVTADEMRVQLAMMAAPEAHIEYHVMTHDDIAEVVAWFAAAATRACAAGVDAVEIHAAHGYLIDEFLSPRSNARDDVYGGGVDGRSRLFIEILRAMRAAVGDDFPIWVRLNGHEYLAEGTSRTGTTIDDTIATARLAVDAGADAIHVSGYADASSAIGFTEGITTHFAGYFLDDVRAVKANVDVPVIAVGNIDPELAEAAIRNGDCDFVALGRALLADPALPQKLREGRRADIRPCAFHYKCISQIFMRDQVRCAVNPELGREQEFSLRPAAARRRVLIAGAGPAGLEAARIAARRGHHVVLCDATERLGGRFAYAAIATERNGPFLAWLVHAIEASDVEVHLGTHVTPEVVATIAPDVVIDATGARWERPAITIDAGASLRCVDDLHDWYFGNTPLPPGPVVVLGGGRAGMALADLAQRRGHSVAVVEASSVFAPQLGLPGRWRLVHELRSRGVELRPNTETVRVERDHVVVRDLEGAHALAATTVLVASVVAPNTRLVDELDELEELDGSDRVVHRVGDCVAPRFLEGSLLDAARVAHASLIEL